MARVWFCWTLAALLLFPACDTGSGPGDSISPDGDIADGDLSDGDTPDGDLPDGDSPDGDGEPDGDEPDGDGDADGDTPPDGDEPDGDTQPTWTPIAARDVCAPTAAACDASTPVDGLYAAYRKDHFLPYEDYPEASIPDPVHGGRVQIVGRAAYSGAVRAVLLNGVNVDLMTDNIEYRNDTGTIWLHWVHVWPRQALAGEPIWVAFHSHNTAFDEQETMHIEVSGDEGALLAGDFRLDASPVAITYVTTNETYDEVLIHVRNRDSAPQTLERLVFNGRDVTATSCIPNRVLEPGAHALWSVPLCEATRRGAAYTVVAEFSDAPPAVGAGRVIAAFFPVHTWPQSPDCPFPGGSEANFLEHRAHGFDTFFVARGQYDYEGCNAVTDQEAFAASLAHDDIWMMHERSMAAPQDTSRFIRFIGDEADKDIKGNPLEKSLHSIRFWQENPEVATYLGGSRNRHTAAFAGVADIQGMDIYIGACPPYILDFGNFPPLRSVYDYALTTKLNHMPLTTWVYSQGFSSAWNIQPNVAEARISTMSVILAGAKGLMYFQTNLSRARDYAETWEGIGLINRDIRGLRPYLREGEISGLAHAAEDALVEVIRTRDVLVVGVMNLKTLQETTDFGCITETAFEYIMDDHEVDIRFDVPADMAVAGGFEVSDAAIQEIQAFRDGRTITIPSVRLSHRLPNRFYVFASDPEATEAAVRGRLEADTAIYNDWFHAQGERER